MNGRERQVSRQRGSTHAERETETERERETEKEKRGVKFARARQHGEACMSKLALHPHSRVLKGRRGVDGQEEHRIIPSYMKSTRIILRPLVIMLPAWRRGPANATARPCWRTRAVFNTCVGAWRA